MHACGHSIVMNKKERAILHLAVVRSFYFKNASYEIKTRYENVPRHILFCTFIKTPDSIAV